MKHFYVYILKCSDNSYYTGVTSNLENRLIQHEEVIFPQCYTASRLPVELVFWERFYRPLHAIDFEKQVKGWSRKKKEALILGHWDKLKELAVCKNDTNHVFKDRDKNSDSHEKNSGQTAQPDFDSAQPDPGSGQPDC